LSWIFFKNVNAISKRQWRAREDRSATFEPPKFSPAIGSEYKTVTAHS
jgi:hypothetical protein